MVFTDGLSTIQRNVNDSGCLGLHRQGIGDDHRVPPVEGVPSDATGLGQGGDAFPRRSCAYPLHALPTRFDARPNDGVRDRVARGNASRDGELSDDSSEFDPRALNELHPANDPACGCSSPGAMYAGLVVCVVMLVAAIVLGCILF